MQVKDLFREVKYPIELYNKNGNEIYYENSKGYWFKKEYNENGVCIYCEDSTKYRCKYGYDKKDNIIYKLDSKGHWFKKEYDENGRCVYFEDSISGIVLDNRPKPNKVITKNAIYIEKINESINKLKKVFE